MPENKPPPPNIGPPPHENVPPPLDDIPVPIPPPLEDGIPERPTTHDGRQTLLGKRFTAGLIDGAVGLVILWVLGVISPTVGWLGCAAYILLKDGADWAFMKQRSIGKKVMKLRPVRLSGEAMDLQTSAKRNWPLALPALFFAIGGGDVSALFSLIGFAAVAGEIYLTVKRPHGLRFGDQVAETEVR
ncbi:MAG: putative RDD family membrane protein YckC [Verrucomicrobiales bacterium]|jgi:uncharacterized RDD family membrane protein YckC